MANYSAGGIEYDARINTASLKKDGTEADTIVKGVGNSFDTHIGNRSTNAVRGLGNAFSSLSAPVDTVLRYATTLGTVLGGISLGSFFKAAGELQQTNQGFQTLIGNTKVANKLFADLFQYSNRTPLQAKDVTDAARTLLGFGTSAQQTYKFIKQLGDVSGATGGDFKALSLVAGQIFAQGKIQAQDFYQIINSGAGALGPLIAKNLGLKGVGGLRDAFEKGQVSAEAFFKALDQATSEGGFAFQGAQKQAETFNGRISTLKDTVTQFGLALIGVKIDPQLGLTVQPGGPFDKLSKFVTDLTPALNTLAPKVSSFVDFLIRNLPTIGAALAGLAAAFITAKIAAIAFNIAASANPYVLIATAIAALVGLLVFLQIKFDIFGKAIAALQPIIQPIVELFQTLFHFLGEQLAPAIDFVRDHIEGFKQVGLVLLVNVLTPLILTVVSLTLAFAAGIAIIGGIIYVFNKIASAGVAVYNFFSGLPGVIRGAIGDAGSLLYDVGRQLIAGLVNGIKSAINAVKDAIGGAVQGAVNHAKSLLGIHSPSTVFKAIGINTVQGFANGVNGASSLVSGAMDNMYGNIAQDTALKGTQTINGASSGASSSNSSTNVTINLSGVMTTSRTGLRDTGKMLIEAVNEELRAQRKPELGVGF